MFDSLPAAGSGLLDAGEHRFPVRVYWEDTDGSGIVYHAGYLRFAERARTELLRLAGVQQRDLLAREGIAFPVRRLEIDYLSPALLDDALEIATRLTAAGAASIDLAQAIRRDGEALARLKVKVACVGPAGRPVRIPAAIRQALDGAFAPGETGDATGTPQSHKSVATGA
jgi:acyl-CoA thioester hydrolase